MSHLDSRNSEADSVADKYGNSNDSSFSDHSESSPDEWNWDTLKSSNSVHSNRMTGNKRRRRSSNRNEASNSLDLTPSTKRIKIESEEEYDSDSDRITDDCDADDLIVESLMQNPSQIKALLKALRMTYKASIYRISAHFDEDDFVHIPGNGMKRDKELQSQFDSIRSAHGGNDDDYVPEVVINADLCFECDPLPDYEECERNIQLFLKLNGEDVVDPVIPELGYCKDVMERHLIEERDVTRRYKKLIGQRGVRAKIGVDPGTVLGQYTGNEVTSKLYDNIFELTSGQNIHDRYAYSVPQSMQVNFTLDPLPLEMDNDDDIDRLQYVTDLMFINDCRRDFTSKTPTKRDEKWHNVQPIWADVDGWPKIFMIAIKRIKAGQQLFSYYGEEFVMQIENEKSYSEYVEEKKERMNPRLKKMGILDLLE